MFSKNTIKQLYPLYILVTLLTLVSINNSFFWDKDIIISKQAYWFFENHFNLDLPLTIDNGHPAVLSFILAFLWKIFGKSLLIGHLLMLPFSIGIVYQLFVFLNRFFQNKKNIPAAILLIILDATLLSQMIVVSSDLILSFCLICSFNAILSKKRFLLLLSILGLGLIHFRGIMLSGAIFLFDIYILSKNKEKDFLRSILKVIPAYMPMGIILTSYFLYHYFSKGWIFNHEASPWTGCFVVVDLKGFIKNIFIVGWRIIDFGRIFLWLALVYFFVLFYKKKIIFDDNLKTFLIIGVLVSIVTIPSMLIYKVLSGHRYLISLLIIISIIITYILFEKIKNKKLAGKIYIILLIGLITGNLWVYPEKIAQGWDSTLGSLPYFSLRNKMLVYIEENNIPIEKIGSDTPMSVKFKFYFLNDDERIFKEKNFNTDKYILYTNVINEFTDKELDILNHQWVLEKEYKFYPIYIRLFKNPMFAQ